MKISIRFYMNISVQNTLLFGVVNHPLWDTLYTDSRRGGCVKTFADVYANYNRVMQPAFFHQLSGADQSAARTRIKR